MNSNKKIFFLFIKIFIILLFLCYFIPVILHNLSGIIFKNLDHEKYYNSIFVNKNLNESKTYFNTLIKILHFIY
jgi:hypothetical protein